MRTGFAVLLVGGALALGASPARAQFSCQGYREEQCRTGWSSQVAYHIRIDRDGGGQQHLVTWEVGPEMALLQRRVDVGISLLVGGDTEGDARMGGTLRAARPVGPVDLELGLGLLAVAPEPSRAFQNVLAHAGVRVADRLAARITMEVIRASTRDTRTQWYLGLGYQRHPEALSLAERVVTGVAWAGGFALLLF